MKSNMTIETYVEKLNDEAKKIYNQLKAIIIEADFNVIETTFVSQPYYYLPQYESIKPHYRPSIMLVFFKDHVNIFTQANEKYRTLLPKYKFTDKHTLQFYFDQEINKQVLINLFKDALQIT